MKPDDDDDDDEGGDEGEPQCPDVLIIGLSGRAVS